VPGPTATLTRAGRRPGAVDENRGTRPNTAGMDQVRRPRPQANTSFEVRPAATRARNRLRPSFSRSEFLWGAENLKTQKTKKIKKARSSGTQVEKWARPADAGGAGALSSLVRAVQAGECSPEPGSSVHQGSAWSAQPAEEPTRCRPRLGQNQEVKRLE